MKDNKNLRVIRDFKANSLYIDDIDKPICIIKWDEGNKKWDISDIQNIIHYPKRRIKKCVKK